MFDKKLVKAGLRKLARRGIKTMNDVDAYRYANKRGDGSINSRYGTLKALAGEQAADYLLHELSLVECFGGTRR